MFPEGLVKTILVGVDNVLNCIVIDNEGKHDGVPIVLPESRGGGCFIVVEFGNLMMGLDQIDLDRKDSLIITI